MIADIIIDGGVLSLMIYVCYEHWATVGIGFAFAIVLDYYREKRAYEEAISEW